jgi:hypothetical protein
MDYRRGYRDGVRACRSSQLSNGMRKFGTLFKNGLQKGAQQLQNRLNRQKLERNPYRRNSVKENTVVNWSSGQPVRVLRKNYKPVRVGGWGNFKRNTTKSVGNVTQRVKNNFTKRVDISKSGLERFNPFKGTTFFGPSKPGYVNNNGVARTSAYRNAKMKKNQNEANRIKKNQNRANSKQLLNRLANEEAARLFSPKKQNTLSSQQLFGKLSEMKKQGGNYKTNSSYQSLTSNEQKEINEALELIMTQSARGNKSQKRDE